MRELLRRVPGQALERQRRVRGQAASGGPLAEQLGLREGASRSSGIWTRGEQLEQVEEAVVGPVDVVEDTSSVSSRDASASTDAGGEEERLAVGCVAVAADPDEHREGHAVLLCFHADERRRAGRLGGRVTELVAVVDARDLFDVLRALRAARAPGDRAPPRHSAAGVPTCSANSCVSRDLPIPAGPKTVTSCGAFGLGDPVPGVDEGAELTVASHHRHARQDALAVLANVVERDPRLDRERLPLRHHRLGRDVLDRIPGAGVGL